MWGKTFMKMREIKWGKFEGEEKYFQKGWKSCCFFQNLNYSVAKLFLFGGKKIRGKIKCFETFWKDFLI
jgi:hypothetical protein